MVRTEAEKKEFIKFTAEALKVKPGFTIEFADIVAAAEKATPVRRRGGGGRRISPSIDIAAQQEATRLREQVEQQRIQDQITQQKITKEQEQIRQEKIFSGTIAGQIQAKEDDKEFGKPVFKDSEDGRFEDSFLSVERVEKPERFLPGLQFDLSSFVSRKETKGTRGDISFGERAGLFGAKVIIPFIAFPSRIFEFGKGLVTEPIQTIKSIPGGFISSAKQIGRELKSPTPETALGTIAGEFLLFKGLGKAPSLVTKTSDIVRTIRLKELPTKDIIAPEFLKGQTFPRVREGQTAGELLGEFKPVLPGETRAGGFTATPKPFAKATKALPGTSELPGLFQAPKVSPRFLRISGEAKQKIFSLKIFDTFKPSIIRITPSSFKLIPGVSPGQTTLGSLKEARAFFVTRTKAPKGKSFVPFIKTEKEAVIPAGTELVLTDKRFFIKFEGRRVPIFEFKTIGKDFGKLEDIGVIGKRGKRGKIKTIEDISESLSEGRVSESGFITPLTSLSFIPSKSISTSLSNSGGFSSSFTELSSLPRRIIPRDPFSPSSISPPSRRGRSGFDIPSFAFSPTIPKTPFEPPIPTTPRLRREVERKLKKIKVKKKKKIKVPIRPSFTAIVTGFKSRPFISKRFGVSPFTLRGLRTGTPKRRSEKLTNL